jgi:hypothetical protein
MKKIMQFFECFLLNAMKNDKIKEIMQFFEYSLLNAMKKVENKGNNAIF